jgi:hypothetical protein
MADERSSPPMTVSRVAARDYPSSNLPKQHSWRQVGLLFLKWTTLGNLTTGHSCVAMHRCVVRPLIIGDARIYSCFSVQGFVPGVRCLSTFDQVRRPAVEEQQFAQIRYSCSVSGPNMHHPISSTPTNLPFVIWLQHCTSAVPHLITDYTRL